VSNPSDIYARAMAEAAKAQRRARVLDAVAVLAASGWTIDGQAVRAPADFGAILPEDPAA
jgi:hypothetical protein